MPADSCVFDGILGRYLGTQWWFNVRMQTEHKKPLNGKAIIEEYTLFFVKVSWIAIC